MKRKIPNNSSTKAAKKALAASASLAAATFASGATAHPEHRDLPDRDDHTATHADRSDHFSRDLLPARVTPRQVMLGSDGLSIDNPALARMLEGDREHTVALMREDLPSLRSDQVVVRHGKVLIVGLSHSQRDHFQGFPMPEINIFMCHGNWKCGGAGTPK